MMKRDTIPPIGGNSGGGNSGAMVPKNIPMMKPETIQHQIKKLKDSYDLAVLRMNEFSNMYNSNAPNVNMYVKVHGQKASKVYSALSSLIYASIAIAKVEGLEDFVKQNSASLPSSMIDLEEWQHILNLAKDCREHLILKSLSSNPINSRKLEQILPKQTVSNEAKKKMQLLEFLAINPIRNTRDEVVLLRQSMIDELNAYQGDFTQAMNLMYFVVKKLRDMQNADMNAQRVFSLKQQAQELAQTLERTKKENEEAYKNQKESYEKEIADLKESFEKELQAKNALISNHESTISSLSSSLNGALKKGKQLENENNDLRNQLREMTEKYNDSISFNAKMDIDYQKELAHMHAQYISDQTVDRGVFKTVAQVNENDVQTLAQLRDNLQSMINTLEFEKAKHLAKIAQDANSMDKFQKSIIALEQCKKELEDERLDLIAKKTDLESKKSTLELEKANLLVHQAELEGIKAVLEIEKVGLLNVQAELESQRSQLQNEKSELVSSKSVLEGEKSGLLILTAKLESTIEELQHSGAQVQSSLQELKQVHVKLQEDFDRVSHSHESLGKSHSILVENLSDVQKAKKELEDTKSGLEKTIEDLQKKKMELENKLKQTEEKAVSDANRAEQFRELMAHAKEESENSKRQAAEVKEDSSRFKQGYDKVVFELQGVIEDLRREKQQLLDVKDALENTINEIKLSLAQVEATLADLRQVYNKLQIDYNDLNKENDGLKEENNRLLQNISDVEKAKKELEETKVGLENTIESLLRTQAQLEAQVKAAEERSAEEMKKAETYKEQMRRAKEETETSKRKAEEVHEDSSRFKRGYDKVVFELQVVIEELRERIKSEKAELGSAQALIDAKQATIDAHLAKVDYQQSTIDAQKQANETQKAKLEVLKVEVESCKEEIASLHASIEIQKKDIDRLKNELDAKCSEISQQKSTIESQSSQIDDLQSEVAATKKQIDSGKSEMDRLQNIIEDQKKELAQHKEMLDAKNSEMVHANHHVEHLKLSVDSANNMDSDKEKEIENHKAMIATLQLELDNYKSQVGALTAASVVSLAHEEAAAKSADDIRNLNNTISNLEKALKEKEELIEKLKKEIDDKTQDQFGGKEILALKSSIGAQEQEISDLKELVTTLRKESEDNASRENKLKDDIQSLEKQIDNLKSLESKLKVKESEIEQLEEHLSALQGKQQSHQGADVKSNLWINDQTEQLQKVINSLKDENVALQNENSSLHESLRHLEKFLEPSEATNDDATEEKSIGPEVTISAELFNQTEKQLVELLKRVEDEKIYSSKLYALLQVAEKELKDLQAKLLRNDTESGETKSFKSEEVEDSMRDVILPSELRNALEHKIVDLTNQLKEKTRECNNVAFHKTEQERLANLLREEVDKQTEEIIALKSKLNAMDESSGRKKNVGFTNDFQVFSIRDNEPVVEAKEVDDATDESSSAKIPVSRGPSVLEINTQSSPRGDNAAKFKFSPRSAAHYEAQRAVLQILKSGVDEIFLSYDAPTSADQEIASMAELSPIRKPTPSPASEAKQSEPSSNASSAMGKVVSQYMYVVRIQKIVRSFLAIRRVQKAKAKHAMAKVVSQYMYAVRIQSMIRAFLAKSRIRKAKLEELAQASGVLVACDGTQQGQTGWYRVQDQMFYFCVDEKEFVLLCGPITKDLYEIAVDEINQIINRAAVTGTIEEGSTESMSKGSLASLKFPHLKLPKNIAIDRLGLQATRIQIETLLDDLKVRDEFIAKAEEELSTLKKTVYTNQAETILKLNKQVEEYMSTTAALRKEKEALLYKTRFVKEDLLAQLQEKIGNVDSSMNKKFVHLTSAVRGFLGRRRVNRLKLFKLADETGVLVAMSNTVQGESGWYVGPHGSIFYFVLKDGKWILTAGPLTENDFRVTYMQLSGNHKNVAPGKLLTKCAFNLAGDHGDIINQGHLYVSNGNGKLFIALPVDDIIADLSQEQQFNDQELASSLISFNSSLASKLDDSVDSLDGASLEKE